MLPQKIRDWLVRLEKVRLAALCEDPPDVPAAIEATKAKVRLLEERGLIEPPPVLTPEQEAQLRERMEVEIAEAEAADRRFRGRRDS
jgi:hypothetical protein